MIVDCDLHWHPANLFENESLLNAYLRCIPRAYDEHWEWAPVPGTDRQQVVLSKPKGYPNLNLDRLWCNPQDRLEAMDKAKVDKAILRTSVHQGWFPLELAKQVNDLMAKYVREYPDRFLGLASVPPWGDKESLYELERCIKDLGFCGVCVLTHYGNKYLDAEEIRPFLKKINELNVPVCVHHNPLPVDYQHLYEYTNLRRLYGRAVDQMTCLGRILYSGMLDELPNLKFIHTEMAGGFFAYKNNIAPKKSKVREEVERFDPAASEKISGYLERHIYFDVSHPQTWGKETLEFAIRELGADHVLYGSSYPVRREWMVNGVGYMQSLDIGEKEKSLIMGGNAVRLFNIH